MEGGRAECDGRVLVYIGRCACQALGRHYRIPKCINFPSFSPRCLQEVVTQSGQLQYASEQMLKERSFASRAFVDGRKRFVVPIEEIEAAFWACPAGLGMKVTCVD